MNEENDKLKKNSKYQSDIENPIKNIDCDYHEIIKK